MKKGCFFILVFLLNTLSSSATLAEQNYQAPPQNPPATTSAIQPPSSPADTVVKPKPIPQYTISLTSPVAEQTFQSGDETIAVSVAVNPPLEPDDKVVILVDGQVVGDPSSSTSLILPWLERGEHTLQAKIIQPKGNGAETPVITIYQQRTSTLLPRR